MLESRRLNHGEYMGILNFLRDGLLHTKRGESDATREGRRAALKTEFRNPYPPGTKEFSEWMTGRKDEMAKQLEAQQW